MDSKLRIDLDYDNSSTIRDAAYKLNRSASSIVNEIIKKVDVVAPEGSQKVKMQLGNKKPLQK